MGIALGRQRGIIGVSWGSWSHPSICSSSSTATASFFSFVQHRKLKVKATFHSSG